MSLTYHIHTNEFFLGMAKWKFCLIVLLAIIGEHCVHNIINLPYIIEETLRDFRRKNFNTDESYFKQRPLLAEYDFIVVSGKNSVLGKIEK